ncbi:SMP-30/gluconolactonase/LRE family protein [Asticcacaulis sp. AC402]|uniref:SMP-30/gluconolactonase/LRE family protein n=1 Tax=Asticcacaulis sp. AC402 TaxID=1282361 RepID=UPI0003C3F14B|nr:SMP-30/gluconolactonase/LRE family protein [Asticcacaulis sp. AC402]ESQ75346.1 hypothetical protein ABAC402_09585 [Asticcacaulis sp. AC402]
MRWTGLFAAATWLAAGSVMAQDFEIGAFRQHRAAAVAAVNSGNFATARMEVSQARAMLPSAPSVLLLGAQIEAAAGDSQATKAWLDDYLKRGLWFDPARYPGLAAVLDDAGKAQLAANGADFGTFSTLAEIPDAVLVENVAIAGDGKLYFSTVREGALNRFEPRFIVHDLPGGQGGYGLVADGKTAWLAVSPGGVAGVSAALREAELLHIDLKDGTVVARFSDYGAKGFNDLALGRTDLYSSDSQGGAVYRLKGRAGKIETLIPAGKLGSPQGLAESPDGKTLIVADYPSGLWRVDLATGAASLLAVPDDVALPGTDGVTRDGNDLIVVQNGVSPARVLRVHLTPDWQVIESVEVLLRGGVLEEPTGGVIYGGDYVFVARSQWTDFGEDGAKVPAGVKPAIIGRLKLRD